MKYEVSRSNTFQVIALQRSVDRRTDGRTDRQTDRQTDKVITIGLPHLRWRALMMLLVVDDDCFGIVVDKCAALNVLCLFLHYKDLTETVSPIIICKAKLLL